MNYLKKDNWHLTLPQRIAIFTILFGLIIVELFFNASNKLYTTNSQENNFNKIVELENELASLIVENKTSNYQSNLSNSKFSALKNDSIKPFNPNDLTKQGWEKIGFTPKQAEVIMKYKQIIGGSFESKEQVRKCYVISDEIYLLLEPKILLPNRSKSDEKLEKYQLSKKVNYSRFNPNNYSEKDWVKIGFSPKQAESILKYKNILGGEFQSKEQIRKCYVISDEKYNEMQSFIDLPEKTATKSNLKETENKKVVVEEVKPSAKKIEISEKFNPNNLTLEDWTKVGFTEKQAQTILNFKKSLGGKFKDANTLKKCYAISESKFTEIEPFLIFD